MCRLPVESLPRRWGARRDTSMVSIEASERITIASYCLRASRCCRRRLCRPDQCELNLTATEAPLKRCVGPTNPVKALCSRSAVAVRPCSRHVSRGSQSLLEDRMDAIGTRKIKCRTDYMYKLVYNYYIWPPMGPNIKYIWGRGWPPK